MSVASQKLDLLRARLLSPEPKSGALLVVYPPEEELTFRSGLEDILKELKARSIEVHVFDMRTLVFDVLESKGLLQKAFQLDAANSRDMRQNLAGMVQRETVARLVAASADAPAAILCLTSTASLYPWISLSALLEETENKISNLLVIPFPGNENGPALHFMGVKDGYNYRAARI